MNARIIKETRSLLPVFAVMLLGAVCPPLIWRRDTASGVAIFIFVTCAAIMAASSFGNEFQWRTLPMLLAQPLPRRKIWLEKMLVLAAALAVGFLSFIAFAYVPEPKADGVDRLALALIPLCFLCGAPYLTLGIKNTIGAAAVIVILPIGGWLLLAGLEQSLAHFFPRIGTFIEASLQVHELAYLGAYAFIYCAVAGWLGYSMFMELQAVDSQTRELNLPPRMEAALARPLRHLVPGYTGPWMSLFRKELQLQRPCFIIAGLMVALAPLQIALWKLFHSETAVATLGMNFVMCIFVIPLVATGMSVAEERNLGVAGWQFIQPVSARKQWAAKILVVLFVCLTLGVLLPAAGLAVRQAWFGGPRIDWPDFSTRQDVLTFWACVSLFYLLLVSLGVYASSVSRTTLQAVIHTLALIMIFAAAYAYLAYVFGNLMRPIFETLRPETKEQAGKLRRVADEYSHVLRTGVFTVLTGLGALMAFILGLFQFLAFANFRKGDQAPERAWLKSGVLVVLVCGFTFAALLWIALLSDDMVSHWIKTHL